MESLNAWREGRDARAAASALDALKAAAQEDRNIMPPSIEAAKAGVTTGEWGAALREVLGEYRAPTGVAGARASGLHDDGRARVDELRAQLSALEKRLGRRPKLLVGKPGLDGHSN